MQTERVRAEEHAVGAEPLVHAEHKTAKLVQRRCVIRGGLRVPCCRRWRRRGDRQQRERHDEKEQSNHSDEHREDDGENYEQNQ